LEIIHDKKAAVRNTVVYAVFFVLALFGLFHFRSITGRIVMSLALAWAIGGLTANYKAVSRGFPTDD
jgi:hypothetical protein